MTTTKTSQKPQFLILLSYTIVWLFSLISFWCCSDGSNAAGYAIVFFYGLFPITTFATSAVIGAKGLYGNWKWIAPIKLGIMYMLADYCTFRLANNIAFEKLNSPEWILLAVGAGISLVGMLAGVAVRKMKERKM